MGVNTEGYCKFLQKYRDLFWHFDKSKLDLLSHDVVVEYILNYGDDDAVKELFALLGTKYVGEIFKKNTQNRKRKNYLPIVENFFNYYFNKHVFADTK